MSLAFKSVLLLTLAHASLAFPAFATCTAPNNAIEAENCLPGNPPSQWYVQGGRLTEYSGFCYGHQRERGPNHLLQNLHECGLVAYRYLSFGILSGSGARLVTSVSPPAPLPQNQPPCLTDGSTGLTDCGNWAVSASWRCPARPPQESILPDSSGWTTGEASPVIFVVRNDSAAPTSWCRRPTQPGTPTTTTVGAVFMREPRITKSVTTGRSTYRI